MPSFEEKVDQMRRIFRGQESYGGGTPAEQATEFRFNHLMADIVERARENSLREGEAPRPLDFLISLAGFSPATTILAYELLRPKRLLVVTSAKAEEGIDVIGRFVVGPGKLSQRNFRHQPCNPTDPLGIYKIVREELGNLPPAGGHRPYAMLDITGGKKVMSATAALAAWQLDLPLCYVDSEYDTELRQPQPGTERLLLLENPTTLFGDQEMTTAEHLFGTGAYDTSRERFNDLCNRISDPSRARFWRDLSALYRAWNRGTRSASPACRSSRCTTTAPA